MNIETGEIKAWDDLTDEERASGKWVPATPDAMAWFRERQARAEARAHNRMVRREAFAEKKPGIVAARIAKAEAKRAQRAKTAR